MNKLSELSVSYLRGCRTIHTMLLENGSEKRILYIYNYEGVHFRVFNFVTEIVDFFDDKFEPEANFEIEDELDHYLYHLNLQEVPNAAFLLGLSLQLRPFFLSHFNNTY